MGSALDEILDEFATLVDTQLPEPEVSVEVAGNFRCEGCVGCSDCRFCTECENCRDCTYCHACNDSLSLTQCRYCEACETLTHSDLCGECSGSSYLTLCLDCEDCVQCFGCVGLVGAEFHILNEKVPRNEYFKRVKVLRAELDAKVRVGWRPPWGAAADAETDAAEADVAPDIADPHVASDVFEPDVSVPDVFVPDAGTPNVIERAAVEPSVVKPAQSAPELPDPSPDPPPVLPEIPPWGDEELGVGDLPMQKRGGSPGLSHDDLSWLDAGEVNVDRTTLRGAPRSMVPLDTPPTKREVREENPPPRDTDARSPALAKPTKPNRETWENLLADASDHVEESAPSLTRGARPRRRTAVGIAAVSLDAPRPGSLRTARRPPRR